MADLTLRPPSDPTPPTPGGTPPAVRQPAVFVAGTTPGGRNHRLVVSWIHGSFRAAVFRRQTLTASWVAPRPAQTVEGFSALLQEAIRELKFAGLEASLVLESEDFSHQMESVPPVSHRKQRDYIRNRAKRAGERTPQAYGYQRTFSPKKEENVILHLLPQTTFDAVVTVFEQRHLSLVRLFPFFALLPAQVQRLNLKRNEIVLMAAENAGVTSIVAGRHDGSILFGRAILNNWRRDAARTATEINRSILFARQRFGITIDTVCVVGEAAPQAREALIPHLDSSFTLKAHECGALEWLGDAVRTPVKDPANLLATTLQNQARRKLARFAFAAVVWLGLALAAQDAWRTESDYQLQQVYIADLRQNRSQLQASLTELGQREAAAASASRVVDEVLEKRPPPVAAHFIQSLASHLPDPFRLTRLQVAWRPAETAWSFQLAGESEGDADTTLAGMEALETSLSAAPFRAKITNSNKVEVGSFVSRRAQETVRLFQMEGRLFE